MRGSHCALMVQVVNGTRPPLSRFSFKKKTNSYSDKIKCRTRGAGRILKRQQMTFSESHLFPLSHSRSPLPLPHHLPFFPLSHPLMVIYLAGKGFAFSPETSTRGRERKQGSPLLEGGKERRERWKPTRDISSVSVSLATPNASFHSPLQP